MAHQPAPDAAQAERQPALIHFVTFCVEPLSSETRGTLYIATGHQTTAAQKGGCMKKIMVALIVGSLLTATSAVPVFAHGWDGAPHVPGGIFNPLWPVAVALSIPAAVVGTVANLAVPAPVDYRYGAPPVVVAPPVYSRPARYYPAREYVEPRGYYAPRGYYPSGYYPARYHRTYRGGW